VKRAKRVRDDGDVCRKATDGQDTSPRPAANEIAPVDDPAQQQDDGLRAVIARLETGAGDVAVETAKAQHRTAINVLETARAHEAISALELLQAKKEFVQQAISTDMGTAKQTTELFDEFLSQMQGLGMM
jgi:hypothetical protein